MKKKTWLVRTLSLCLALFMAVGLLWTGRDLGVRADTQYNEVEAHFGVSDGPTVIYLSTEIAAGPDVGKSLHAKGDGTTGAYADWNLLDGAVVFQSAQGEVLESADDGRFQIGGANWMEGFGMSIRNIPTDAATITVAAGTVLTVRSDNASTLSTTPIKITNKLVLEKDSSGTWTEKATEPEAYNEVEVHFGVLDGTTVIYLSTDITAGPDAGKSLHAKGDGTTGVYADWNLIDGAVVFQSAQGEVLESADDSRFQIGGANWMEGFGMSIRNVPADAATVTLAKGTILTVRSDNASTLSTTPIKIANDLVLEKDENGAWTEKEPEPEPEAYNEVEVHFGVLEGTAVVRLTTEIVAGPDAGKSLHAMSDGTTGVYGDWGFLDGAATFLSAQGETLEATAEKRFQIGGADWMEGFGMSIQNIPTDAATITVAKGTILTVRSDNATNLSTTSIKIANDLVLEKDENGGWAEKASDPETYNEVEVHFGVLEGTAVIRLTTEIVAGPDAGKSLHAMSDGTTGVYGDWSFLDGAATFLSTQGETLEATAEKRFQIGGADWMEGFGMSIQNVPADAATITVAAGTILTVRSDNATTLSTTPIKIKNELVLEKDSSENWAEKQEEPESYNEVEVHFGVQEGTSVIYLTTAIVVGPDAGKSLHAMSDGTTGIYGDWSFLDGAVTFLSAQGETLEVTAEKRFQIGGATWMEGFGMNIQNVPTDAATITVAKGTILTVRADNATTLSTTSIKIANDLKLIYTTDGWAEATATLTVGGENTTTLNVSVRHGDTLPTGYMEDGKYILGWKVNGQTVTQYDDQIDATAYTADFVDTKMLQVKLQDDHETRTDATRLTVRFIGSVDSLSYASAGFALSLKNTAPTVDTDKSVVLTKVYGSLNASGVSKSAAEVYDPYSAYMFAYALNDIPVNTTIYVRAYVRLEDGTYIYGATRAIQIRADGAVDAV